MVTTLRKLVRPSLASFSAQFVLTNLFTDRSSALYYHPDKHEGKDDTFKTVQRGPNFANFFLSPGFDSIAVL